MIETRASEPTASVDAEAFKAAMRCLASSVTVITSGAGSGASGMTATAVCSVSAEPPSILVVVNQASRSHALIEKAGAFAVNLLSESQVALAKHFASKPLSALANVAYRAGMTGVPILEGCAAHLECLVDSQARSGTHSVFFGRVISVQDSASRPLLYWQGRFTGLGAA